MQKEFFIEIILIFFSGLRKIYSCTTQGVKFKVYYFKNWLITFFFFFWVYRVFISYLTVMKKEFSIIIIFNTVLEFFHFQN